MKVMLYEVRCLKSNEDMRGSYQMKQCEDHIFIGFNLVGPRPPSK